MGSGTGFFFLPFLVFLLGKMVFLERWVLFMIPYLTIRT